MHSCSQPAWWTITSKAATAPGNPAGVSLVPIGGDLGDRGDLGDLGDLGGLVGLAGLGGRLGLTGRV